MRFNLITYFDMCLLGTKIFFSDYVNVIVLTITYCISLHNGKDQICDPDRFKQIKMDDCNSSDEW